MMTNIYIYPRGALLAINNARGHIGHSLRRPSGWYQAIYANVYFTPRPVIAPGFARGIPLFAAARARANLARRSRTTPAAIFLPV